MLKRLNVLRFKTCRIFYMSFHVLLHLLNEMRQIDNKYVRLCQGFYHFIINKWNIVQ